MIVLLGSVLVASTIGSLHCAGMCGGLVCFVSGQGGGRIFPQLAYHGGRALGYALLGALAGAIGLSLDRLGALAGMSRGAAVVAGAIMIAWGAAGVASALGARLGHGPRASVPLAPLLRGLSGRTPVVRAFVLGALTPLLPCGWLWAFCATAAATGSAAHGAVVMLAFWLGTVPMLVAVGTFARTALGPLRRRAPLLTAAALIAFGLFTVTGKLGSRVQASGGQPGVAHHGCH